MTEDTTTETDPLAASTDPPDDHGDAHRDEDPDVADGSGADAPDDHDVDAPADSGDAGRGGSGAGAVAARPSGDRDAVTYLYWGLLVGLGLFGMLALFRFYDSASAAISLWVAPQFEPVLQAAFNLVVLLGTAVGISLVVRELAE